MEVIKLRLRDLRRPDQAPGLYDLTRSPVRVGRGPRCEIRLHTEEIADVQVILRREVDRWFLHPVGPIQGCSTSTGWLMETCALARGDSFVIGHVAFEFDPAPEMQSELNTNKIVTPELHLGETPSTGIENLTHSFTSNSAEKPLRPEPAPAINKLAGVITEPTADFLDQATTIANATRPLLKKISAAGAAGIIGSDHDQELSLTRRLRSELKPAASRLADTDPETLPDRKPESLRSKLQKQSLINDLTSVVNSPAVSAEPLRGIRKPEISAPASLNQTLNQWAGDNANSRQFKPIRHGISARPGFDISESSLKSGPIPRLTGRIVGRDLASDSIAFESTFEKAATQSPRPAEVLPVIAAADTHEIQPESLMSGMVVETSPELAAMGSLLIDAGNWQPEQVVLQTDTEEDTVDLPADSTLLGIAEIADSVDSGLKCNQAADFEEWLAQVEPIFGDIPAAIDAYHVPQTDEPESHESLAVGVVSTELEEGSVEMLIEPVSETSAVVISHEMSSDATRLAATPAIEPDSVADAEEIQSAAEIEEINTSIETGQEADLETWPSVNDIMRWQARKGSTIQTGLTDLTASERPGTDENLEPAQVLKFNPAFSVLIAMFVGLATIAGSYLAYRTGMQDDLTQKAISAVIASARSEQPPRLPAATLAKLAQDRAWWELPADQIWWRATLMKQRENAGLEVPRASEELANRASQASPILPTARLWKLTRYPELTKAADWNSLSRDVLSLVTAADHFRRIGEHDRAKSADKSALEMVTRSDMIFDRGSLFFDSELGTNRFLLPGQHESLTILKRLAKETNAYQLILDVVPDGRPEVWLTAAELIERNALGDPSPLYTRILELDKGIPAGTTDRQRLHQAVLAEARAQKGELGSSIEIYQAAMAKMPESDLKRSWFYNLGELSQRNQKNEAAIAFWRKARGINPNHEVDRHAIAASRSLKTGSGLSEITTTTLRTN